jgi:hypothetical protein
MRVRTVVAMVVPRDAKVVVVHRTVSAS